jgi:hypothetical protein
MQVTESKADLSRRRRLNVSTTTVSKECPGAKRPFGVRLYRTTRKVRLGSAAMLQALRAGPAWRGGEQMRLPAHCRKANFGSIATSACGILWRRSSPALCSASGSVGRFVHRTRHVDLVQEGFDLAIMPAPAARLHPAKPPFWNEAPYFATVTERDRKKSQCPLIADEKRALAAADGTDKTPFRIKLIAPLPHAGEGGPSPSNSHLRLRERIRMGALAGQGSAASQQGAIIFSGAGLAEMDCRKRLTIDDVADRRPRQKWLAHRSAHKDRAWGTGCRCLPAETIARSREAPGS